MKEIVHYDNQNLVSIKPFENNYEDRNYFQNIIENLHSETNGYFYFEFSRPNFDTSNIIEELRKVVDCRNNLYHSSFETIIEGFYLDSNFCKKIPKIWFAYEHVGMHLLNNNETPKHDLHRKSWQEATKAFNSFVIFKGIEENVIWIGKSDHFDWPIFLSK